MARPIRVEFPDAVYHVTARGNERKEIFLDDRDRRTFLRTTGGMVGRFGVIVHAYCLMPNHYHLLVQTPRANISHAVGWLQCTYSIRFNHRWKRSGHLFQGRYKAHLVEHDAYAGNVVKYIHANPARKRQEPGPGSGGCLETLEKFAWSSHRAWAGDAHEPAAGWLCLDWLGFFGDTPETARAEYRRQVKAMLAGGDVSPFDDLKGGLVLGGDVFFERVKTLLAGSAGREEQCWTRKCETLSAREVAAGMAAGEERKIAMWVRVRLGGEPLADVSAAFGYRQASGAFLVVTRLEKKAAGDPALSQYLKALEAEHLERKAAVVKK